MIGDGRLKCHLHGRKATRPAATGAADHLPDHRRAAAVHRNSGAALVTGTSIGIGRFTAVDRTQAWLG
jgi:hypothetical protein